MKKNSDGEKELKFYNEIFTIKFDYVSVCRVRIHIHV